MFPGDGEEVGVEEKQMKKSSESQDSSYQCIILNGLQICILIQIEKGQILTSFCAMTLPYLGFVI